MAGLPVERPTLMLVTDRRRAVRSLFDVIDSAVDAGVDVVQIREKDLSHTDLVGYAREIVSIVGCRARVIVNTDIEAAVELGIGLHLPEAAPALTLDVVEKLDAHALVGRSIHSTGSVAEGRVDYLLFGHIYPSNSKPASHPRGLVALTEAVSRNARPILAIGGITEQNAASVIEHGACGVAVIGAILEAPGPHAATTALRAELDRAAGTRIKDTRKTV